MNLGFFFFFFSLRTLYNSMVFPYLYYCNLAWGGTYETNLQRIVILQKRALRIVNNSTYDAHTGPIFKKLIQTLKFHDIHLFQLGFFMFSFQNFTLPSKFNNLFIMNSQIQYNTRNAHFFLPATVKNKHQTVFNLFPRSKVLQFFEFPHNWFVLICIF